MGLIDLLHASVDLPTVPRIVLIIDLVLLEFRQLACVLLNFG